MKRAPKLLAVLLLAVLAGPARSPAAADPPSGAKPAGKEDQPVTVRLVLSAAAEPKPALAYRLLPGLMERKPGNAAVLYNKIGLSLGSDGVGKLNEKASKWLEVAPADLPREEVRRLLAEYRNVLEDLELAARRETCDWQLLIRERSLITLLLPELQMARACARLLAVQARLQAAEGQIDQALHTLQTGYALARHVAEGPTLVNGLVGIAIAHLMATEVEHLIQRPGAPNLYWALTSLPQPLIEMHNAVETEMNFLYLTFPELATVNQDKRTPAEWEQFLDKLAENVALWSDAHGPKWQMRLALTALAVKGYPQAKRSLIEQGRSPQEVEAMPVAQVLILHTMQTYLELRDQTFKWFYVPYWQARARLAEVQEQLQREAKQREIVPLASLLLPAVGSVQAAVARSDRRIAVLRIIEALRLYAAGHEARLPATLADVTEVPVPLDPMTGQAFTYRLEDGKAILEAPAPPGMSAKAYALRYEITLTR